MTNKETKYIRGSLLDMKNKNLINLYHFIQFQISKKLLKIKT